MGFLHLFETSCKNPYPNTAKTKQWKVNEIQETEKNPQVKNQNRANPSSRKMGFVEKNHKIYKSEEKKEEEASLRRKGET